MFFNSMSGVRQVENLTPSLFSIFLNDHVQFMSNSYNGLSTLSEDIAYTLNNKDIEECYSSYTCCCMPADDTVIFAESPDDCKWL